MAANIEAVTVAGPKYDDSLKLDPRPARPMVSPNGCCGGSGGMDKLSVASTLSSLKGNNWDSASCGDRKQGLQNLQNSLKSKADQQL
mmetsp:Transcript_12824/g.17267  ORF Transcript_12824/g.17267 Transcript_12824/m.17267 type:complete len:87 (+) Transcript_12824:41-301(+)